MTVDQTQNSQQSQQTQQSQQSQNSTRPWLRTIRVTLGPLEEWRGLSQGEVVRFESNGTPSGLRVECSLQKTIMGMPNPSQIKIYNLAQDTRNAIRGGLTKITVEAGWAASAGTTSAGATSAGATSVGATSVGATSVDPPSVVPCSVVALRGVPITNYGVAISLMHDVLERSLQIFPKALQAYNQAKLCTLPKISKI